MDDKKNLKTGKKKEKVVKKIILKISRKKKIQ